MLLRDYILTVPDKEWARKVESEHTEWLDLPCRVVGSRVLVFNTEEEASEFDARHQVVTFNVQNFYIKDCMKDLTGWAKQRAREEKVYRKEQMKNLARYHNKRR